MLGKGSNSHGSGASISCEGATNQVGFFYALGYWKIEVNGSIYESSNLTMLELFNDFIPNHPYLKTILDGSFIEDYALRNKSSEFLRIRFIGSEDLDGGQPDIRDVTDSYDWFLNPTWFAENMQTPTGKVSFCLAPQTYEISCAGATNNMFFTYFSQGWDIEVDGQRYPSFNHPMSTFITNNLNDKLIGEADGLLNVMNISDQNIRVRFIPVTEDASFTVSAPENLTFMEHEDGSLTFCLAPQSSPIGTYPTYAVLKTTAAWGTTIPATIVVNGNEYTGSLVNELAAILDQQYHVNTVFDEIEPSFPDGPNAVRIVFSGTEITENLSIYIEFLSEIDVSVATDVSYPPNDTLVVMDGFKAQFNLGKRTES